MYINNIICTSLLLIVFQLAMDEVWSMIFNKTTHEPKKLIIINGTKLDFLYWNSNLGNENPIELEFRNESNILDYWINDLPLKVVTHGWLGSDENSTGVFNIKTAYVDIGGYNVISIDWSIIADNIIYPKPAYLTNTVGSVIAEFLDNIVKITGIDGLNIHLIGHSLGAHVMGSCGSHFKSGEIGRITGLDPAAPGFEFLPIQLNRLSIDDAKFVDVIHTSGISLGYLKNIGHVDFFPNRGVAPQPGCGLLELLSCSHSRAHELYTDSIYYRLSLMAIKCNSWTNLIFNKCSEDTKIPMGHDTPSSARGLFYLKTNSKSPFGIS